MDGHNLTLDRSEFGWETGGVVASNQKGPHRLWASDGILAEDKEGFAQPSAPRQPFLLYPADHGVGRVVNVAHVVADDLAHEVARGLGVQAVVAC